MEDLVDGLKQEPMTKKEFDGLIKRQAESFAKQKFENPNKHKKEIRNIESIYISAAQSAYDTLRDRNMINYHK